jgi:hypothetical protein
VLNLAGLLLLPEPLPLQSAGDGVLAARLDARGSKHQIYYFFFFFVYITHTHRRCVYLLRAKRVAPMGRGDHELKKEARARA